MPNLGWKSPSLVLKGARRQKGSDGIDFKWLGLPTTRTTLPLLDASQAIPAFTRRPFQIGSSTPYATVNPYYEVIVRLPTDEQPTEIPVGLVSRNYQLIQHHEILQRAASTLASLGVDPRKITVNLDLTVHGERMSLGLVFPKDSEYAYEVGRDDVMALYLEFINSVDGSLRLAFRVSWLRLVCTNGLMLREVLSDFSRMHIGVEILKDFESHLPGALASVVDHKKLFERWISLKITDAAFGEWTEETLRKTWGLKAAVRAHHIALRGVDVEIEKMVRGIPAGKIPVRDKGRVPGSLVGPLSLFAVSQALTWLAGDRGDIQEQLEWKSQVYQMVTLLLPNSDLSVFPESGRLPGKVAPARITA